MKFHVAFFILCLLPASAIAEETLNLFPKGRAAYQGKFDANAERYEVNGRNFVDDLYQNQGEGSSNASADEPMLPEEDLDAYLNGAAKQAPAGSPASDTPQKPGK